MDDARARWSRPDLAFAVAGVLLAAITTVAFIAMLSGLRAAAAPAAVGSDLALFDSDRGLWHLRYGDGSVDSFYFGVPGDTPLLGDWDCDGVDTVALFRQSNGFVYLRNTNDFGVAQQRFFYGAAGDVPLRGDWDGDGCDSLGVQRDGQFFLADELGTVPAGSQFFYGEAGDIPFVGDFDGDGRDSIGLHRVPAGRIYLANSTRDGQVPETVERFYFGLSSDRVLAGDWDADGDSSVGLYRPSTNRFHLALENGQPFSDEKIDFGRGDWIPVIGSLGVSPSTESATLIGAGDIALCRSGVDEATATLLDEIAGTVFTTGDNVYPDGSEEEYADCYDPSWGRHVDRTRPSPGNHDYHTANGAGYYSYFGTRAGENRDGWYSYELGGWHVVVLNSNCSAVGGCDEASAQYDWLVADLAATSAECILAYWHHPLFNAGGHQGNSLLAPLWDVLHDAGADVVLNGHDHNYQRWARQDPAGEADPDGIRQFVVGTGGAAPYGQKRSPENLEVFGTAHGLLQLQLDPTGYEWEFIPVAGTEFTDRGSESCSR
jgi:hypothetical protein